MVSVILLTPLCAGFFEILLRIRIRYYEKLHTEQKTNISIKKVFIFWWCFILLSYIPVFLAYYPGIFAYDVSWQIPQFVHREFNTHHPIIHTLLLGICYQAGHAAGWASQGIALYCVIQMTVMSAIFAWCIAVMAEKGVTKIVRFMAGVFYAWAPFHSVMAVSTTKDVLFSGLCLFFVCFLWKNIDKDVIKFREKVVFIVATVSMLLFRNNAVYALMASAPFIVLLLKRNRKRWLLMLCAGLILFFTADKYLVELLHAERGSINEMLGVPIQQLARTENEHIQELETEQVEQLEFFIPREIAAKYDPYRVDSVKFAINVSIEQNINSFIGIWQQLLIKYPVSYLDAFLLNCQGYWYLYDVSHAFIYGNEGYMLTNHVRLQDFLEDTPGVEERSLFPALRDFMEKVVTGNEYQKLPVLSLIFSPCFYFWLYMICIMYAVYIKKYKLIVLSAYPLAIWLTCLLGPCAIIRYAYPYVVAAPICIAAMMKQEKTQKEVTENETMEEM